MATRIAVDAMGGDHAPSVVVEGALQAVREADDAFEVVLYGPEALLRRTLADHDAADALPIVDAPDVIGMAESPSAAVKRKAASSIHRGLAAVKEGRADAFVSAGNTGAVMAASLFILGRLPGVQRPTILGIYPTVESACVVLDVGTNVDCKPEHLVQFAQMGAVYAEHVLGRERPVVALMNIGEEPGKGNEQTKEAFALLQDVPGLHFRGNIEGRDLMHHAADVVVCDGFVGNIMLKLGESVVTALPPMLRQEMVRQQLTPEQAEIVQRVFQGVKRHFDYEEFGGAPLLGVDGTVLIGHGSSSPRAVSRLVRAAADVVRQHLRDHLAAALQPAARPETD